jgi:NADPH:quinone reductase
VRAVVVPRYGGPEVLELREVPEPRPGAGDFLVEVEAIGVNYHDSLARRGALDARPPFVAGVEGAGTIVAAGPGASGLTVGQRVAWPFVPGSYAEMAVIPGAQAVPVPDGVSSELAASLVAQALTAHFLTFSTYPVRPGDDVLVHAAAGGVGLLLVQLARHRGGRVLATTSSKDKAGHARRAGAAEVLAYEGVASRVRELTDGKGVNVVFDGVGAATFESSLAAVGRRGHLVLYGASSGPVPLFDLQRLSRAGSPYVTRPSLLDYIVTRDDLLARAESVFGLAAAGIIEMPIAGRYSLAEASAAQRQLEDRSRAGKLIIFPRAVPESVTGRAVRVAVQAP